MITLVGAVLEAAGIGIVIPFISIIVSDDFIIPRVLIEQWPYLANTSRTELLIGAVVGFVLFYLFKSIFLLWLVARQTGYYVGLQEAVSRRLFKSYLGESYTFHLQHNSAKLLSNTITESMLFSVGFTSSVVLMLNDFLIVVAILLVLLVAEPIGAAAAVVIFGAMSILLFGVSKRYSAVWGETRQQKERLRIKSAQQGFSGVKDIKLYGRESFFINEYAKDTHISLEASRKQTILQNLPRVFLEFVAVSALCCAVVFLFVSGDQNKILTTVGLFAAAAFKLLPTIARLVQSSQAVIFTQPVVSFIYTELVVNKIPKKSIDDPPVSLDLGINFVKSINMSDVSFTYDGAEKPTLDSISLDIGVGKMIGFIGSSGAGKSTLIDCLLGLINPSSGEMKVDNELITERNVTSWQRKIGYVSQVIYLLDGSLKENISFGIPSDAIDQKKLKAAVEKSQLTEFVASLPDGLETVVGERGVRLSGGQRQRIGIARALYNNPPVLVLDEATSSLDIDTEHEVMKAVVELQGIKTILIIAHRFSTVENCDYVYKLDKGRIVAQGEPQDIIGMTVSNS